MEKKAMIEVRNLSKRYSNGVVALKDVSFRSYKGEIVGYVGPNGSGKTTTIKILTNLLASTSGSTYIKGIDVKKYPKEALRHVGALIEVPGIYDYLTPNEMLTYFGRVHRMSRTRIKERIEEVMGLVKLAGWEEKKIGSFSTGMQRRLVIAKAIFHEPEILIMDEPVIGLDPKGIKMVRELVEELAAGGTTVFLSSHLLKEVAETCHKIVFLDKGKVVEQGPLKKFIGKGLNLIKVRFLSELANKDIDRLSSLELIKKVEPDDSDPREVAISYDGEPGTSSRILAEMIGQGHRIVSYTPVSSSLEDFYISHIGEERGVN